MLLAMKVCIFLHVISILCIHVHFYELVELLFGHDLAQLSSPVCLVKIVSWDDNTVPTRLRQRVVHNLPTPSLLDVHNTCSHAHCKRLGCN